MQFSHRDEYVAKRIAFRGCHLCDLGLETYVRRIVERLVSAIGHDGDQQRRSHWLPATRNVLDDIRCPTRLRDRRG